MKNQEKSHDVLGLSSKELLKSYQEFLVRVEQNLNAMQGPPGRKKRHEVHETTRKQLHEATDKA